VPVSVPRTCARDPADVPNLKEEERPLAVDGVDDRLPRLDLLLRPDAGGLRVPQRGGGDDRGLRDEQAATCGALRVVNRGVRLRHVAVGAAPRQGREHHAVRELERPHLVRRQQRDHLLMMRHLVRAWPQSLTDGSPATSAVEMRVVIGKLWVLACSGFLCGASPTVAG
jgi:hypothetical protein